MKAEDNVDKLKATNPIFAEAIPFSYFNHRGREVVNLINNEDEAKAVKGEEGEFSFELKSPIFLIGVIVVAEGYSAGDECEFNFSGEVYGDTTLNPAMDDGGRWAISVSDIVTGFSFVPPRKDTSNLYVKSVSVYGLEVSEIGEAFLQVGEMENLKNEILKECESRIKEVDEKESLLVDLEEKNKSLEKSIEEANEKLKNIEGEVSEGVNVLDSLKKNLKNNKQHLNEIQARIEATNSQLETKTQQRQQIISDLEEAKNELKRLKDNINLFPTEVQGFVEQGAKNINQYMWLSAIPIFIIAIVTGMLFLNAADLTHFSLQEKKDVWEVVLSRIPYVSVCVAILAACYKISRIFISEIIRINEQRLNLTKVGIIAKDVTDACNDGLELDDDVRYENRVRLKMELLREHLKNYIGGGYAYSPRKKRSEKCGGVDGRDEEDLGNKPEDDNLN
ncbi:hypothetical protein ACEK07_45250 [Alcanivoracaceae bacterium MT1]